MNSNSITSITDYTALPPPPPTGEAAAAGRRHQKFVLLFWAPWHEASAPGGEADALLNALAESVGVVGNDDDDDFGGGTTIRFGRVHAEDCASLSAKYGVEAVPTFVLLDAAGQVFDKIECGGGGIGGDNYQARVTQAVQRLIQLPVTATTATSGTRGGDGGAAVSTSHAAAGTTTPEQQLSQRLDELIRASEVMLFMKGTPSAPRCGFSRQVVELLTEESIPFGSFDILSDESVRQGLKSHSNWPTYPQLYVKGELIGGLDILKEMKEDGPLRDQLSLSAASAAGAGAAAAPTTTTVTNGASASSSPQPKQQQSLDDRLKELVTKEPVMLFMKGLPSAPKCGFSSQMVEILDSIEGLSYGAFDILQDEEVRQGLKKYSDWPTYPQVINPVTH